MHSASASVWPQCYLTIALDAEYTAAQLILYNKYEKKKKKCTTYVCSPCRTVLLWCFTFYWVEAAMFRTSAHVQLHLCLQIYINGTLKNYRSFLYGWRWNSQHSLTNVRSHAEAIWTEFKWHYKIRVEWNSSLAYRLLLSWVEKNLEKLGLHEEYAGV